MGRRRELKSVAHDLVEFLNNRNFDLEGYWGVGLLAAWLPLTGTHAVDLNLLDARHSSRKWRGLEEKLQTHLRQRLTAKGIPLVWLRSANLRFKIVFDETDDPLVTCDVRVGVSLVSDLGKEYSCSCSSHAFASCFYERGFQRRRRRDREVWAK